MKSTEMNLFSAKEQSLLMSTERTRLSKLTLDELGDILTLVRRARDKYSSLHRRQATTSIDSARARSASASDNSRTLRKAEIFDDALARVSTSLASAARVSRDELKKERLAAARGHTVSAPSKGSKKSSGTSTTKPTRKGGTSRTAAGLDGKGHVTKRRMSDTRATNARVQAKRDSPRSKSA